MPFGIDSVYINLVGLKNLIKKSLSTRKTPTKKQIKELRENIKDPDTYFNNKDVIDKKE